MDHTEGTIVPPISSILNEEAVIILATKHHSVSGETYVEYALEVRRNLWTHIFDINAIPKGISVLRHRMRVKDILDACDNVEIWYDGYAFRLLTMIQAPCPSLAYI